MIIAVVVIEDGIVSETFTSDDNEDIYIIDLDTLPNGQCPICSEEPSDKDFCYACGINWDSDDINDIARSLLKNGG